MENIKIFGIGLGKTGTKSLTYAMAELGYKSKHGFKGIDAIQNFDFCNDIFITGRYKFLDYCFVDAKFILTIRDLEPWIRSSKKFGSKRGGRTGISLKGRSFGARGIPLRRSESRFLVYGICHFDEDVFRKVFAYFNNEVLEHFKGREEKLLVMNICAGDGWEKLCNFLDKPIPKIDFPHAHQQYKEE